MCKKHDSCSSLLLILLLFIVLLTVGLVSLRLLFLLFLLLAGVTGVTVVRRLSVDGLADLERGALERLKSLLDLVGVLGNDSLVERGDVTLDLVLDVLGDAGGVLLKLLLGVVDVLVSLVLKVNDALHRLISLLGALGLLHHAVDVGVGETTAGADRDLLLLAGRLVLGGDVHDTVGIDVESDLDLGHTTRSHGDALKIEIAELLVVLGELALTLENGDADLSLVISGSGESLALLGGNGRVSVDQSGEDATHGLNTQGEGSNVQQEDILDITGQDGTLDSGANSDSLVRVNTTVGRLVEEALNGFTDLGDTAGAANH